MLNSLAPCTLRDFSPATFTLVGALLGMLVGTEICSIFIFITNSHVRGERMTDRECIIEYERGNPTEEERDSSRRAVCFVFSVCNH